MNKYLTIITLFIINCSATNTQSTTWDNSLLKGRNISVEFNETPAEQAMQYIKNLLGYKLGDCNIIFDNSSEGEIPITMNYTDEPADIIVENICKQSGLALPFQREAFFIGSQKTLDKLKDLSNVFQDINDILSAKLDQRVTFCWPGKEKINTMSHYVARCIDLKLTSDFPDDKTVGEASVIIEDMSAKNALIWLAALSDASIRIEDGIVILEPMKKGKNP